MAPSRTSKPRSKTVTPMTSKAKVTKPSRIVTLKISPSKLSRFQTMYPRAARGIPDAPALPVDKSQTAAPNIQESDKQPLMNTADAVLVPSASYCPHNATPLWTNISTRCPTKTVRQRSETTVNGSTQDPPLVMPGFVSSSVPNSERSNLHLQSSHPRYLPVSPALVQSSSQRYPRVTRSPPNDSSHQIASTSMTYRILNFELIVNIETTDGGTVQMNERDGGGIDCNLFRLFLDEHIQRYLNQVIHQRAAVEVAQTVTPIHSVERQSGPSEGTSKDQPQGAMTSLPKAPTGSATEESFGTKASPRVPTGSATERSFSTKASSRVPTGSATRASLGGYATTDSAPALEDARHTSLHPTMKPPSSETACGKAPQSRSFSSIASNAFSTRPDIATASAQPQVANRKPQTSRETLLKGSASTMSRQMLPTSNHVPSQQTSIEPVARADSMKRQSFPSERAAYAEGISNELRPGVMPSPYQPPGVMPSPYQPPGVMPSSYHPHGVMPSPYQPHGVMPSPYQPHDAMPSPYQPPGVVPSPYQPPGVMPSPQAPDEPSSAEDGEIHEPKRLKMTTTTSTPQARVVPSGSSQFLQAAYLEVKRKWDETDPSQRPRTRPPQDPNTMNEAQRARFEHWAKKQAKIAATDAKHREERDMRRDARKGTNPRASNPPKDTATMTESERLQYKDRKERKYGVPGVSVGSQQLRKQRQRKAAYEERMKDQSS